MAHELITALGRQGRWISEFKTSEQLGYTEKPYLEKPHINKQTKKKLSSKEDTNINPGLCRYTQGNSSIQSQL